MKNLDNKEYPSRLSHPDDGRYVYHPELEQYLSPNEVKELRALLNAIDQDFLVDRSFASSPVKFLLESVIDRLILVGNIIKQGGSFFGHRNSYMKFKESRVIDKTFTDEGWYFSKIADSDPLGNPRQVTWEDPDLKFETDDPRGDVFFDYAFEISSFLRGFPLESPYRGDPQGRPSRDLSKQKAKKKKKLSKAEYHYLQRRSR
jgi:hypothetical protein